MAASVAPTSGRRELPAFAAPYAPPDEEIAAALAGRGAAREPPPKRASTRAPRGWSRRSAPQTGGLGGIEDFLHAYSLSTKEGLALMVLAEALLRVPDAATADRLIEDKLAAGDWTHARGQVERAAWSRPRPGRSASRRASSSRARRRRTSSRASCKRLGLPAVRAATRQAMRLLGSHFVLGQTIEEALGARRRRTASSAIPSTCWARARAPRPTPRAISKPTRDAIDAIGARAGNARAAGRGPASRSSSRRCIRATRRCRASACWPS